MPRTATGFERTNGEFVGDEVWQEDLDADIEIIAQRHDIHDQDLADGIFGSLPRDGSQPMLDNLNFGGFTGINLAPPSLDTDIARFGDTVTGMTWDDPNSTLILSRQLQPNLSVVLPGIGAGAGTVTSITPGAGLEHVQDPGNPITGAGTLRLTDRGLTPGQYVNPTITVTPLGIITAIANGSGSGGGSGDAQFLRDPSAGPSAVTLRISRPGNPSVTQDSAVIQAATTTRAGVMTASQVQALETATQDASEQLTSGNATLTGNGRSQNGYLMELRRNGAVADSHLIPVWDPDNDDDEQVGAFNGTVRGTGLGLPPAVGSNTTRPDGYCWFVLEDL